MIRMVIVGSWCDHNISIPFTDLLNDLQSHFKGWHQLSIVIIQNIIDNAESFTRFLCLGKSSLRKFGTANELVTGITICHRQKFYCITHLCKNGCGASPIIIAVIGMCADHNNANLIIILGVGGGERGKRSEEHTSELQSQSNLVCRLLLEKKKKKKKKRGKIK